MSLDYAYEPKAQIIIRTIVGHGSVSNVDRDDLAFRILTDPYLPKSAGVKIDISAVTNAPTGDACVIGKLIENLHSKFRGRVAIVNGTVGHITSRFHTTLSCFRGR